MEEGKAEYFVRIEGGSYLMGRDAPIVFSNTEGKPDLNSLWQLLSGSNGEHQRVGVYILYHESFVASFNSMLGMYEHPGVSLFMVTWRKSPIPLMFLICAQQNLFSNANIYFLVGHRD